MKQLVVCCAHIDGSKPDICIVINNLNIYVVWRDPKNTHIFTNYFFNIESYGSFFAISSQKHRSF